MDGEGGSRLEIKGGVGKMPGVGKISGVMGGSVVLYPSRALILVVGKNIALTTVEMFSFVDKTRRLVTA